MGQACCHQASTTVASVPSSPTEVVQRPPSAKPETRQQQQQQNVATPPQQHIDAYESNKRHQDARHENNNNNNNSQINDTNHHQAVITSTPPQEKSVMSPLLPPHEQKQTMMISQDSTPKDEGENDDFDVQGALFHAESFQRCVGGETLVSLDMEGYTADVTSNTAVLLNHSPVHDNMVIDASCRSAVSSMLDESEHSRILEDDAGPHSACPFDIDDDEPYYGKAQQQAAMMYERTVSSTVEGINFSPDGSPILRPANNNNASGSALTTHLKVTIETPSGSANGGPTSTSATLAHLNSFSHLSEAKSNCAVRGKKQRKSVFIPDVVAKNWKLGWGGSEFDGVSNTSGNSPHQSQVMVRSKSSRSAKQCSTNGNASPTSSRPTSPLVPLLAQGAAPPSPTLPKSSSKSALSASWGFDASPQILPAFTASPDVSTSSSFRLPKATAGAMTLSVINVDTQKRKSTICINLNRNNLSVVSVKQRMLSDGACVNEECEVPLDQATLCESVTSRAVSSEANDDDSQQQQQVILVTDLICGHDDDGNKLLNEYAVLGELGRGAYGKVKLAINTRTENTVAIKILHRGRLQKINAVADIKAEIALMENFRHPNIVRLHAVIDDPTVEKMYMVMEYVPGGTLNDLVKVKANSVKQGINPEILFTRFLDVLHGLQYLHNHNVVHMD
eukprot:PhM_4_TR2848/c0_g1_i1/m.36907